MCVIIYKPANVKLPNERIIEQAARVNHDGCGLCVPNHMIKSLDFNEFRQYLPMIKTAEPALIHFRWATNGSIRQHNCHPFYDGASDTYFMHNGVMPMPAGVTDDITDSEANFRRYFAPSIAKHGLQSKSLSRQINAHAGASRLAFMQGDEVRLAGNWHCVDGVYYSNLNFIYNW